MIHLWSSTPSFNGAPRRKQRKQSPRITVNHSKVADFDIAQIGYYLAHVGMI